MQTYTLTHNLHARTHTYILTLSESDVKTWKTVSVANELEGFRVLRSTGPPGTLSLLAQVTHAITRAYCTAATAAQAGVCINCRYTLQV
jgi:hypothetical protein